MSIEFELEKVYHGWENASVPDDLKIVLRRGQTTHRMRAALRELLQLYGCASAREDCNLGIGTGQSIHLEYKDEDDYAQFIQLECKDEDDYLRVRKVPLNILTTGQQFETALEELLTDVFSRKDAMSDSEERSEKFEYLDIYLEERGVPPLDVEELYHQLVDGE